MNIRVAFVLVVLLAVAGAVFILAPSDAQGPHSTAATVPAAATSQPEKPAATEAPPAATASDKTVAEQAASDKQPPDATNPAAAPSPAANAKPAAAAPAESETPVVAKPKHVPALKQPTPIVTAPPPASDKPAVAKAPEQKSAPVVSAPVPQPEKPAAAKAKEPQEKQPAPVVTTTPPAPPEKPAAATTSTKPAPSQTPTPVVAAPTPAPKPVIVMTPLPQKRPKITKALIDRTEPAKELFAAVKLPSTGPSRVIGYYSRGCLQGAVELPITGPTWQVMRLSRNRNWGDPELVRFIKRFSAAAAKATGWPGILIGDMAQPRGGPLPYGHVSHQVGLDVDIWYTPMPDHTLTRKQRETLSATHMVAADGLTVNKNFTAADAAFLRTVAQQPGVERVLVNAAIKKKMCELEGKHHDAWMAKLRPWYGHTSHIHVRLKCPANSPHCRHQSPVPAGDGCGKKALAFWFTDRVLHPKPAKHPKPRKQIMLSDLPAACKAVLNAPAKKSHLAGEER